MSVSDVVALNDGEYVVKAYYGLGIDNAELPGRFKEKNMNLQKKPFERGIAKSEIFSKPVFSAMADCGMKMYRRAYIPLPFAQLRL